MKCIFEKWDSCTCKCDDRSTLCAAFYEDCLYTALGCKSSILRSMQLILLYLIYEELSLSLLPSMKISPFLVQFTPSYRQAKGVTDTSL